MPDLSSWLFELRFPLKKINVRSLNLAPQFTTAMPWRWMQLLHQSTILSSPDFTMSSPMCGEFIRKVNIAYFPFLSISLQSKYITCKLLFTFFSFFYLMNWIWVMVYFYFFMSLTYGGSRVGNQTASLQWPWQGRFWTILRGYLTITL